MEDCYLYKGKIIGKSTGDEELDWMVGNLIVEQKTGKHYIVDLSYFSYITKLQDVMIEVDPFTVCRCTGYRDKNDTLIYENDIVECKRGIAMVIWDKDTWRVQWSKTDGISRRGDLAYWINKSDADIEVIGNRFDVSGLVCPDVPNMDENEAIEKIRTEICQEETATHCTGNCMYGTEKCAYSMAIKALKEVQQYRAIGTLEERKQAIETCKAKKPIPIDHTEFEDAVENAAFLRGAYWCPNCKNVVNSGAFCHHCGQKLDWSDEE